MWKNISPIEGKHEDIFKEIFLTLFSSEHILLSKLSPAITYTRINTVQPRIFFIASNKTIA